MTREEYLKRKILEKGTNLKAIALEIGVPYSTLRDMQTNVGSARIDNVIKLCQYLGVTVDELDSANSEELVVSEFEKNLIWAYRENPDMRKAVNKLLDLDVHTDQIAAFGEGTKEAPAKKELKQPEMIKSFRAANSKDNHEPEVVDMEDLSSIPQYDGDEI